MNVLSILAELSHLTPLIYFAYTNCKYLLKILRRDPNLSSKNDGTDSKYPAWPLFTKEEEGYKDISSTFKNLAGHPNPKMCQFHQTLLPKLKENAGKQTTVYKIN